MRRYLWPLFAIILIAGTSCQQNIEKEKEAILAVFCAAGEVHRSISSSRWKKLGRVRIDWWTQVVRFSPPIPNAVHDPDVLIHPATGFFLCQLFIHRAAFYPTSIEREQNRFFLHHEKENVNERSYIKDLKWVCLKR